VEQTTVGISVTRLVAQPGAVSLTFADLNGLGYAIDLDPATALHLTLMMVNAIAVGADVISLERGSR
jgi:hypothetical protein